MTVAGMRQQVRSVLSRSATARRGVSVVRRQRARRTVAESGLFDPDWYLHQLRDPSVAEGDPLGHYLTTGSGQGLSPHPLFDPSWYRSVHKGSASLGQDPLAHYLGTGRRAGASPHPFFDAAWYTAQYPAAASHPAGPLGHYLDHAGTAHPRFHPGVDPERYLVEHPDAEGPLLEHAARAAAEVLLSTRGFRDVVRMSPTFDHAGAQRFTAEVLEQARAAGGELPLVTVVIPTKDRAQGVLAAVRSVLDQTYQNVQLVVVDDGSTDGTHEGLRPVLDDPRVEYVRREVAGGVSVARNVGLAQARGTYVAYLDSDNTWKPNFLEVMVAFVTTRGLRVGYAVSELIGDGQLQYRATPFDAAALRERNFIDCIVLLHERSLLDEVGGFDEKLRRMVDWDLMIRMAGVTDFALAPFVATTYDLWEERDDRLSTSEPFGFRYVIKSKRLVDWDAAERALPDRDADLVSVVVHARGGSSVVERCVDRLVERTEGDLEVVVVDTGSQPDRALPLQLLALRHPQVRVVRVADQLNHEVASNIGVAASRGGTVVLLGYDVLVEQDWLPPLLEALGTDGVVAAAPLVLRPSGAVLSAGTGFSRTGHPHHLLAGSPWHGSDLDDSRAVPAVSGLCVATTAESIVRARGLDPFLVDAVDGPDLSLRLTTTSGQAVRVVPRSVVVRRQPRSSTSVLAQTVLDNRRHLVGTWGDRLPEGTREAWAAAGHEVVGFRMQEDEGVEGDAPSFAPVTVRTRTPGVLRWSIKTAVPDVVDRAGWGDYYFAVALRNALRRQGHEAVVDCQGAWYRPTAHEDDVVVVLRGKTPYVPNPQHVNLLWSISHPDKLTVREAAGYDRVLVASTTFAEDLARRLGRPVEPLLQCTDQEVFAPHPGDEHSEEVLFVGNSRGVMRPVVRDALAAGLDPVIYGNGWDRLLPIGSVRGRYVPNDRLARTYAGAGVVLNDHWEDMRRAGFISNRLFDLAACGARVVTDPVPGLEDVFGDAVLTYDSPDELVQAVATQLADDPERAAARAELSERVRREHTFDARAHRLVELASRLTRA